MYPFNAAVRRQSVEGAYDESHGGVWDDDDDNEEGEERAQWASSRFSDPTPSPGSTMVDPYSPSPSPASTTVDRRNSWPAGGGMEDEEGVGVGGLREVEEPMTT